MPYTDPQTIHNPATSTIAPASWGDAVRDGLEYMARNRPHCRAFRNSAQAIADSTETAINFDQEQYDVGGMHSTSSNTSRLTVPASEGGKYLWIARFAMDSNSTGRRNISIRLNGTTEIASANHPAPGASGSFAGSRLTVTTARDMLAGDYMEATCWQDSGGSINVTEASLSAIWLAAS